MKDTANNRSRWTLDRLHRLSGSTLCLLFFIWFSSGIVMTFHGYPDRGRDEFLERSKPVRLDEALPPPATVFAGTGVVKGRVRLQLIGERPVWVCEAGGRIQIWDARDGKPIRQLNEDGDWARQQAQRFLDEPANVLDRELLDSPDQWTVYRRLAAHFPLIRFEFDDSERSRIYVSTRSGQVVQLTTATSRSWAWVGAIPHWIYPVQLVQYRGAWRQIVMILAGIGCLVCVSGLVLGLRHLNLRQPYRAGSPQASRLAFRNKLLRWHQILGLSFGAAGFTFVGSGLLSLQPFYWAEQSVPDGIERSFPAVTTLPWQKAEVTPAEAVKRCGKSIEVKALTLLGLRGKPYYLCESRIGTSRVLAADAKGREPLKSLSLSEVTEHPFGDSVSVALLSGPDAYHRPSHFEPAMAFPVARLVWFDEAATWVYIDLSTGIRIRTVGRRGRLERWLYQGLHSLDFPWLYRRPILWQVVIVGLCLGGAALSVSGIAVTTRWLKRRSRRRRGSAAA